jgi:[ribosomal protein S18]-alanine N-acetyltransferase
MAQTIQAEPVTRDTGTRYVLRPMTLADVPQVMDIERDSFPSMWPQTVYSQELKNRLARYFVLVEEGNDRTDPSTSLIRKAIRRLVRSKDRSPPTERLIIGLIGIWLMVDQAHVVTIAVREAFRRHGAGAALLLLAFEVAFAESMESVTLEYRRENDPARYLYEKFGFLSVGVRPRYYTDTNEDAVIMTTPPLKSKSYREKYERLKRELYDRWADQYLLLDSL